MLGKNQSTTGAEVMRIIAIETSSRLGGVAVVENEKVLDEHIFKEGMVHGRSLLPTIKEMLDRVGWQIAEIDAVAVDEGPGSFTGLRIGVMAAKTICWVTGAKLVGVCSADALHKTANEAGIPDPLGVVIDAYRGCVYAALFDKGKRLFLDMLQPEEAAKRMAKEATLVGDGALRWKKIFEGHRLKVEEKVVYPAPRWVALLGFKATKKGQQHDPLTFVPHYLRPSEAEERRQIDASPNRLKEPN